LVRTYVLKYVPFPKVFRGMSGVLNFDGPGLGDLDVSLFRKFAITERLKCEFRVEGVNVTNSPAFAPPTLPWGV